MGSDHARLELALTTLDEKPSDEVDQTQKKAYSEKMSAAIAVALADILRDRGMREVRPAPQGHLGGSGAERRLSGGLGAKKVDITWATEESGLILGISVKCINFRDRKNRHFQKNLTNRRNDMLLEAVTLHRRFPYSTLVGLLFLDHEAEADNTEKRKSTFENAFPRTRLFTGRSDPSGRDEQYERFYICLVGASPRTAHVRFFDAEDQHNEVHLDEMLDDLISLLVERNFDFYESIDGRSVKRSS